MSFQGKWFEENGYVKNIWLSEGIASLISYHIIGTNGFGGNTYIFGYNRKMTVVSTFFEIYGNQVLIDVFNGQDKVLQDMKSVMDKERFVAFQTGFNYISVSSDIESMSFLLNYIINPLFQRFINEKGFNYNIVEMTDFN